MSIQDKLKEFDSEPVRYCAKCCSLKVKYDESLDLEYCADCGSTDIQGSSIEVWEEKYQKRYSKKYVQKQEDPRKTYIFSLTVEQLKTRIYQHPQWKEIIHTLYPKFPGGYSKADSILLFFDKVYKQNRMDELRLLLMKYIKL